MDSSTTKQCKKIEEAVGGALELSRITGSRAYERYTGPQIPKIYEMQPEVYQKTERISLVSSFMASLLIGRYACIDQTDGAGMNLLDINQREWSKKALDAIAPDLEPKLGNLAPAYAVAGLISPYFVESLLLQLGLVANCSKLRFRYLFLLCDSASLTSTTEINQRKRKLRNIHCKRICSVCLSKLKRRMFRGWPGGYVLWKTDNFELLLTWLRSRFQFVGVILSLKLIVIFDNLVILNIGLTLSTPGDLAISLGTSDTVFGISDEHQPRLEGHVFPNPVDTKGYMVMLCYKNGSLTREEIRDRCAEKSWDVFSKYLQQTPPLNGGKLGFYYKDYEILPPLPVGYHRFVLENFTSDSINGVTEREVTEFDSPSGVRAIIEGQLLSVRAHIERCGMPFPPRRLIATSGASANQSILGAVASIFGCDVYTVRRPDSASLGAAVRAAHGWLCNQKGGFVPIEGMYKDKLDKTSLSCKLSVKDGDPSLAAKYAMMVKKRMEIENRLVEKLGRL
ncbi:hypothetical protein Ancab_028787 [Ancistrocladus abbreviatus]